LLTLPPPPLLLAHLGGLGLSSRLIQLAARLAVVAVVGRVIRLLLRHHSLHFATGGGALHLALWPSGRKLSTVQRGGYSRTHSSPSAWACASRGDAPGGGGDAHKSPAGHSPTRLSTLRRAPRAGARRHPAHRAFQFQPPWNPRAWVLNTPVSAQLHAQRGPTKRACSPHFFERIAPARAAHRQPRQCPRHGAGLCATTELRLVRAETRVPLKRARQMVHFCGSPRGPQCFFTSRLASMTRSRCNWFVGHERLSGKRSLASAINPAPAGYPKALRRLRIADN